MKPKGHDWERTWDRCGQAVIVLAVAALGVIALVVLIGVVWLVRFLLA